MRRRRHSSIGWFLNLSVLSGALVVWACSGSSGPGRDGLATGNSAGSTAAATTVAVEGDTSPAQQNSANERAPGEPLAGAGSGLPSRDEVRIAAIERAINQTEAAQHECWAFAAADDFRVRGTMLLRVTFGADRRPSSVAVLMDEPADERLRACIVELFQQYSWPDVFDDGQAVELPLNFKAPRGQYTVAARYAETRTVVADKLQATVLMDERNTGNGAGGMAILDFKSDVDTGVHWHNTATEIMYVLAGQIFIYGDNPRKRQTVKAGQAVYFPPGAPHGEGHKGKGSASVLQFFTPEGPQRRYLTGRPVDTVFARKGAPVSTREAKPIVVKRPRSYPIAGGRGQVAFFFEEATTGHKAAYMGVMTAQPGVVVPAHRHPGESEYLYVVQGGGTMTVASDRYPVGAQTAVQVPANTEHSVVVEGEQPLIAVQFYTPSGPEQRFKQPPARK